MIDYKKHDKVLFGGNVWVVLEVRMVSIVIERTYKNGNTISKIVHFGLLKPYKESDKNGKI